MIPIDRTNYRELKGAIEKRGGNLIFDFNEDDPRRFLLMLDCPGWVDFGGPCVEFDMDDPKILQQVTDGLDFCLREIDDQNQVDADFMRGGGSLS